MSRKLFSILVFGLAWFTLVTPSLSSETEEPERQALQHILTIHELEKELERITAEKERLQQELEFDQAKIQEQELKLQEAKDHAKAIVRAIYQGDRLDLLLFLFQGKTLSDALQKFDYFSYILKRDEERLRSYHLQWEQLQGLTRTKEERLQELSQLEAHLAAQKALLEKVESELAEVMAGMSDTERIQYLQKELIRDWEARGLPAFETFLKALSASMAQVPQYFKEDLTFSLSGMKLTITDQKLLRFLRKQSELFRNFDVRFAENAIEIFGNYQGMALSISGIYQIESEEKVAFQITELTYNGLQLPPAAARELQKKYDLGIYPKQIHAKLYVKSIDLTDGKVQMTLGFSS